MDNAWITFGKAMILKNRSRYPEAKKIFEKLIAKGLLTGRARTQLGRIHYENGDIDKAIKEYLDAKQIQTSYAESTTCLAELYFDQNNFSQLNKLVEQEGNSGRNCIDMLINIGGRYRSKGMLGKAIQFFEKTIYWFPNDSLAKLNLGELYREAGAFENAKRLFRELIDIGDKNLLSAYINLGLTYGLQGLLEDARTAFNFVMERDSDNFLCRFYQAIVFRENGRIEKAVSIFHKLLVRHPNNCDLVFNLSLSFVKDGRYNDAIECFREIIDNDQDSFLNRLYLGVINRECGFYSASEAIFSDLLEEDSDHIGVLLNYALCFHGLEQYSFAIKKINRLLELDPGNPIAKLFLGVFHRQNGNNEDAIKIFKSLMDTFDGHIDAGVNLSLCLALNGKSKDAFQLLTSFYNLWPQNLSILMQYGIINREIGEYDEAIGRKPTPER